MSNPTRTARLEPKSAGCAGACRCYSDNEASVVGMKISDDELNDAGAWVAGRLSSVLQSLPPDDPCYEPVSLNLQAQRRRKRLVGTVGRGVRKTAGKTSVPTDHIMRRFGEVR